MVDRIIWLSQALKQYGQLAEWLYKNAPRETMENLVEDVQKKQARLMKQPFSGRPARIDGVRFVVVRRRWRLYYRVHPPAVYIVYLWDTKRDPKKNPY